MQNNYDALVDRAFLTQFYCAIADTPRLSNTVIQHIWAEYSEEVKLFVKGGDLSYEMQCDRPFILLRFKQSSRPMILSHQMRDVLYDFLTETIASAVGVQTVEVSWICGLKRFWFDANNLEWVEVQ